MPRRALRLDLLVVTAVLFAAVPIATRPAIAAGCDTPGTPTTTVYLPNITKTLGGPGGWVTPFIVQNVGTAAATLEVSFYGFSDGSLVTCRKVTGLAPGTSFADVPNNDTDLPDDSQFAVVVRSFGSQVVSVVNEHQGAGERAEALSYVGLTTGATKVALPYVAKAVGGWVTTIVVQNLGTAAATVTVSFVNDDGTRTATLTRTIGPGRSQFVDPAVETALVAGTEYAVTLSSTQPVAVVANAHNDAPTAARPKGFSYNGIAAAAGDAYLPWAGRNADGTGRSTSILVQNTGSADATPTLTFRRIGGAEQAVVTAPAPVKPGRRWAHVLPTAATANCPAAGTAACPRDGEHSVVVTGGEFAILGYSLDVATAMAVIAGPPAPARIYLPNVTRTLGGPSGWTTPIVLQSAGATSATLRWYRFADGALAVTQYVPGLTSGAGVRVDPRTVTGLTDDTQYAVVVDASGPARAIVLELSQSGGDGAMAYEGFPATGSLTAAPVPTTLAIAPATASVALGATQQLTATVKDQSGNIVIGVPLTWSISPSTLGTVSTSGLFTAASSTGTATVTATFGSLAATSNITIAPRTVTLGGFTFNVRATATADVYAEQSISTADAQTVATTVNADIAQVQTTYARAFSTRPPVYVFPTTSTYTTGLQTVLGMPPAQAAISGAQTYGVFYWTSGPSGPTSRIALNWEKVRTEQPITTSRHELTHMMFQQIGKPASNETIPAWLNEGSARLEEFTISGTRYWEMQNRYVAASMVAARNSFSVADLASQDAWNARTGEAGIRQYHEASQLARFVREDVGQAGVIRMLELVGQGQPFSAAFATVAGRTLATFEAAASSRLQAIAPFHPGIATALDEPGGPGLSYILYGFLPRSTVTFEIEGLSTGFVNTVKTRTIDAYGVSFGYLGPSWPADTYTISATGTVPPSSLEPGKVVTVRATAVKAASLGSYISLAW